MILKNWEYRFQKYLEQHFLQNDKAHDINHFNRVWKTAYKIMQFNNVNKLTILTACYFHDVINLPKNHPDHHLSSRQSALYTKKILVNYFPDFPKLLYNGVMHAIEAHSFSAHINPKTIEAKIVQDADRLESLGAIGLARVFYVAGQLGRRLFHPNDPLALYRPLDDERYTFDHFQTKLLTIANNMQTKIGRKMAFNNIEYLVIFMSKLCAELKGEYCKLDRDTLEKFSINFKFKQNI